MNMISQLRQRVSQEGKATISVEEFNQLQAEWICRCSMTIATELKLFKVLASIQDMCIGEICMNYKMDAEYIGRLISEATGMTKPQLDEFLSAMKS